MRDMKFYDFIRSASAALALSLMSWGCSDDNGGMSTERYMNFATFEGNEGSTSRYTLQIINDSPLITLTYGSTLDESQVKKGERVMLIYSLPEGMTVNDSGRLTRLSVGKVVNSSLEVGSFDGESPRSDAVGVQALYRTGRYVNLQAQLPYYSESCKIGLKVDEAEAEAPIPTAYLIYERQADTPTFDRTTYASIDMGQFWMRETLKGIKIVVENSLDPSKREFLFLKSDK